MGKRSDACVYVIRLDPAVLKRAAFAKANPNHDPRKPCVYVGMTGLTPEERFANHKAGYKDGRFVKEFGIELMPKRYAHTPRMTRTEAEKQERELALRLRKRGYAVWGGSPANADVNKAEKLRSAKESSEVAAKPFSPTTKKERAEAFRLGAQLMAEVLAGEQARQDFLNALEAPLEADEAASGAGGASGRDGRKVWRALVDLAGAQASTTQAGLASMVYGPGADVHKVNGPLFMVMMYCFLSALPNLAAIVEDFEPGLDETNARPAAWAHDWASLRTPSPESLEGALDRLLADL